MKKLLLVLLCALLPFTIAARADDFSFNQLGQVKTISKPSCDDALFKSKALETIKAYLSKKPALSIMQKRDKALKLARISDFEEVDVQNIDYRKSYHTAGALMMIKINKHIDEADILVCRQKNEAKNPIDIVVYLYMDNFKADIINLEQNEQDYERVFFIYP